jgi:hypothetical protein
LGAVWVVGLVNLTAKTPRSPIKSFEDKLRRKGKIKEKTKEW